MKPAGDVLGIFLPLLRDLRHFRLEAKRRAREAAEPRERDYLEALQLTFKVLINSFYGCLGSAAHPFADAQVAAAVTARGRELIRYMLSWLREQGAVPVEIDTDGIYFVPPAGAASADAVRGLVAGLSNCLPEGIEVEMDGCYEAFFSYKKKNYALLDDTGRMTVRGSALRSRGMEKYLRDFLAEILRLLLEGRDEEVCRRRDELLASVERHELAIQQLAKTETLSESPESYRHKVLAGKRNPSAIYQLALSSDREYRAGDQISYYVTGWGKRVRVYDHCKPVAAYDPRRADENVPYYQAKIFELLKKFEKFLPPEALRGEP
jgi:DNA polymerase elongation subunit (family B)